MSSVPSGKSRAANPPFLGTAARGAFQCRRPAIIRWSARKTGTDSAAPSGVPEHAASSNTIRFANRRMPSTRLPATASKGGSTVRSKKGLTTRMPSRRCPSTRDLSASIYASMSGISGISICFAV